MPAGMGHPQPPWATCSVRHHPLGENFLLISNLNLPCLSVKPFPLVLSPPTLTNIHSQSRLYTPFKYWKATVRSPRRLLFSRRNHPNSLHPPQTATPGGLRAVGSPQQLQEAEQNPPPRSDPPPPGGAEPPMALPRSTSRTSRTARAGNTPRCWAGASTCGRVAPMPSAAAVGDVGWSPWSAPGLLLCSPWRGPW